jgi:hypothetical protein
MLSDLVDAQAASHQKIGPFTRFDNRALQNTLKPNHAGRNVESFPTEFSGTGHFIAATKAN